tara:strand:+ start:4891 stop:7737 length:2847 start_codon:yes stop_codon:yes gene_type:complete
MYIEKIIKKINKKYSYKKLNNISFNSKKCKKGDIFFAIKGNRLNGNKFIKDAIKNGAKVIISNQKFEGYKNGVFFIKNKNPRKLLSYVCSRIYQSKPKNLIAVTGTNGKSSIANFYLQILKNNNIGVASIGTLGIHSNKSNINTNNTTLDPVTLHKTLDEHKKKKINNVILEASSHGLKQHRLDYLRFNLAIFTNFSRDHLDYHKTFKDYFNSKMILFRKLMKKKSKAIIDNEILESKKIKKILKTNNLNTITIGTNKTDFKITNHNYFGKYQNVTFKFKGKNFSFQTSLIGKIQIKNLLMAIIAANQINLPMKKIIKSIKKIKAVSGRLEKIGSLKNNSKVILDYAHTPDALKNCIQSVKDQFKMSRISIVFGCGGERDKPKRKIMGKIANTFCDKIYLTDDNPRNEDPYKIRLDIKQSINKSKLFEIPSRAKAIYLAIKNLKSGDVLIVAGKGHEKYQEYKYKKYFSDAKFILKSINVKNKDLNNNFKLNIINENLNNKNYIKKKKINSVSINSKDVKNETIFFGIKGKKIDGNKFADEALNNGAKIAIIDRKFGKINKNKIKVKNSLNLLTKCSAIVRKTSNINTIAITGSSGKTSLKELIGQSLSKISSTCYSKKSYNNKYGVPLSLFNIKKKNTFGIFEAGMDKKGEIDKLTKLISPNLAVITNVSYAHIKNFSSLNQIASAKSEIINNVLQGGTIVLNRDDIYFDYFKKKALRKNLKIISFGKKNNANVRLVSILKNRHKYILNIRINNLNKQFAIKKNLITQKLNLLAALAVLSNFIELKYIKKYIFYNYRLPNGRGNLLTIKKNNKLINIIDESYNSNPLSLEFAINNFDNMNIKNHQKNILLGDMLELGKFSKILHKKASNVINQSNINKIYVYGKYIKETFNKIKPQKKGRILISKKEIISLLKNNLKNNDYLMIKGSNATGLNDMIMKIKKGKINAL